MDREAKKRKIPTDATDNKFPCTPLFFPCISNSTKQLLPENNFSVHCLMLALGKTINIFFTNLCFQLHSKAKHRKWKPVAGTRTALFARKPTQIQFTEFLHTVKNFEKHCEVSSLSQIILIVNSGVNLTLDIS